MEFMGRGVSVFMLAVLITQGEPEAFGMGSKKPPTPPPNTLEPGEPLYCSLPNLQKMEKPVDPSGLNRVHRYQVGKVDLVGVGVGNSQAQSLMKLAVQHPGVQPSVKYCTWYLNEGNSEAEKVFEHEYLTNPRDLSVKSGPVEYHQKLQRYFADGPGTLVSCAVDHSYLALGCNGMKHRGPTVFAMLLAFSGCQPKNAAAIANTLWGLNGVPEEVRLAIAEEGAKMGTAAPLVRKKLRDAFEASP